MTGATGLEPATSGVDGRRSNRLNYAPYGLARARPFVLSLLVTETVELNGFGSRPPINSLREAFHFLLVPLDAPGRSTQSPAGRRAGRPRGHA